MLARESMTVPAKRAMDQLSLAIRGSTMNGRRAPSVHTDQVVDDVFRVCGVAQRARATGRPYFELTLAGDRGRYEAIAGWPAADLAFRGRRPSARVLSSPRGQ